MDMSLEIQKLKKICVLFDIIVLFLVIATVVYFVGFSIPLILKQINPMPKPIYIGILINSLMILAELVCAIIGSYLFLKAEKANPFLPLALIISIVEFKIYNLKLTTLLLEIGFTFSLGSFSIGINIIGVALVYWYIQLKHKKSALEQLSNHQSVL